MSHSFRGLTSLLTRPASLKLDVPDLSEYAHDATSLSCEPAAVLVAESADDIAAALRYCHKHNLPVTFRGAGTGLSGGCVPSEGALIISTERLTDLRIEPTRHIAFCQPGVLTKTVQDEAARHGLTYPPDPASYEESTIGGNVAENAGGLRCKRFGVTRDYVIGLKALLADGSILKTGVFAETEAFPLGELLLGSEGTLGCIIEIALRLVPLPGKGLTMLLTFNEPASAAATVSAINASGLIPTVMEFLDGDAAACSNSYEHQEGLDEAAGILLIETDDRHADRQVEAIRRIADENGCVHLRLAGSEKEVEELWRVRRNLSKAAKAMAKLRVSEDVAVPNSQFPVLVAFVAEMNRTSPLRINSFGHAGDGNLHVNFMAETDSAETRRQVEREIERLMRRTIELGGTLTGEHGIGLAKRRFLGWEFDPATLRTMRAVKEVLDPANRLNPDKLFENA